MNRCRCRRAFVLWGMALALVATALPAAERHLYVPGGESADRHSLSFFAPAAPTGDAPPLLVFVHGGYWVESDSRYGIGRRLAGELSRRGIAVALVRYRLAPRHPYPAQPRDVARALAWLHGRRETLGFDPRRVFLAGHSAGAHLVSLLALDRGWLTAVGLEADHLAGVVSVSGIHDASADAPPFLVLWGGRDLPFFASAGQDFAARLTAAGGRVASREFPGRDHLQMMNLSGEQNPVRSTLLDFLQARPR